MPTSRPIPMPLLHAALVHAALVTATALATVGCGDDGAAEPDAADGDAAPLPDAGDAAGTALRGACPSDQRVGRFEVAQREAYAAITGQVADGVVPAAIFMLLESEGGCQLLRRQNPFCDPGCQPDEVCGLDGACQPYPRNLDAGTVTVSGLLEPVMMTPNVVNSYQNTTIPNPPFDDGASIMVRASGGEVDGFTLHGVGVTPLEVTAASWTITDGAPLEIAWTAAPGAGRIVASFNVDQHGNTPVTLVCDVEDTGSTTVPAALIALLFDYGISGAATGQLYRQTVDSLELDQGCVELDVYSHAQVQLLVGD